MGKGGKFPGVNQAPHPTAPASVSEFLDQFPRVDSYAEIDEILRSPDFLQGSHFQSRPVFGGSLVVIDGPEHRQRRKMLMGMFSHAALRRNEKEILAPAIRHAFEALAATRGADGLVRVDLATLASTIRALRITRVPKRWPACRGNTWRLDTHAGVHREAAVLEGQHLPGLEALDQAAGAANARRMRVRTWACTWATAASSIPLAG